MDLIGLIWGTSSRKVYGSREFTQPDAGRFRAEPRARGGYQTRNAQDGVGRPDLYAVHLPITYRLSWALTVLGC